MWRTLAGTSKRSALGQSDMGLARLLTRAIKYEVTNTETGATELFTVNGAPPLAPDWSTPGYQGGMGIPGAWRAALLIADALGSVPWHAYRRIGEGPAVRLTPTPPLLDQPSPPETRVTTFSSLALDLLWHGNAVGLVASRNAAGYPTSIHPVPAQDVQIRRVTQSSMSDLPIGSIEYQIGSLRGLTPFDVVHVKGPCEPGALRGMGVLEAHMSTLNLAQEQIKQASGLAKHGVPTGLLKVTNPDATEQTMQEAKAGWLKAQRQRTVAVLNATTDFEPLSWNPEEMELDQARRFTREELALIFGVPGYFLNIQAGSMTYINAEAQGLDLVKFTLGGHLARFEQALSRCFPSGTWVKANLDSYLRADTKTRYEAHKIAVEGGWLTVDEVREIEDREPLEGQADDLVSAREMTEMVQKVYLGVGKVITADEARAMLNAAGAGLDVPGPPLPQTPDTTEGDDESEGAGNE